MNNRKLGSIAFASALGTIGLVLACCTGSTDGGEADFSGGQFVGSDANTGSMALNVLDADMSVADTSGFGVSVRDTQGRPVSGMKVSCDSEAGVAILEPASGSETTSSSGDISGVIGCAAPGSYQLACRLSVGSNKRKLVDVKCRGPIPTGFTGFPGAGGGGLGGGSDTSDSGGVGGTDTDGIRITNAYFDDAGTGGSSSSSNFSIDTKQRVCTTQTGDAGAGTPTPTPVITLEPFFDTVLNVRVVNNTNQAVKFNQMNYTVDSTEYGPVSFIGEATAVEGGGGEGELRMLAFQAVTGSQNTTNIPFDDTSLLEKRFVGAGSNVTVGTGFKSVRITLTGTNDSGDTVNISASVTLNFAPFNRCAS